MTKRCSAVMAAWLATQFSAVAANDIDVNAYARAPAFALPALSPDGSRLSYVTQSNEHQSVIIRALRDGAERPTLRVESKHERVRWCDWAGDNHLLCGTVSHVRAPDRITETTRLYDIDIDAAQVRELNAKLADPVRDGVIDLAGGPGRVLLQHDVAGRGYPQVSELDVRSGALSPLVRARPPVRSWLSDGRGAVRLGIGVEGDSATLFVRDDGTDDWKPLLEQSLNDVDAIGPLAFASTASELLVLKHHEGRTALFRLEAEPGATPTLLFADDIYDVSGPVILQPQTRALLAVEYAAVHRKRHFFDAAEAANHAWLDQQLPGVVNLVIDRSIDNRWQLLRSGSDRDPPSLFLFDTERRSLLPIGHDYPELEARPHAPMKLVAYRARDGQVIPGYLTLPRGESVNLPAIVLPHGGPETRVVQGFDPLVQFLAAQGFAVLQMNFRGSLGYGAGFAAAGVGQWGGIIHNDITDGARWLVERKIADPARMCIVGMSFGGYAAMLGAARESQWYSCAVSYAGVGDLIAFSQYTERLQGAELWKERLGPSTRGLWQMSPMSEVRTLETPLLLMHGRHDPVVPISQARRFARALKQEGKTHRLVERADCDHDMTLEPCRRAFFAETSAFLAAWIGSATDAESSR